MIQFPALFYILTKVVKPVLKTQFSALLVVLGFGFYAYFSTTYQLKNDPPLYIKNQVDAAEKVREYQKETDSLIVYDMSSVDSQGLQYLLKDLPSGSATTSMQTTHLVFPYDHDAPASNVYGKLAVWQDPRTDITKKYLVRKRLVIVTPLNTELLESHYHQLIISPADTEYVIEKDGKKSPVCSF